MCPEKWGHLTGLDWYLTDFRSYDPQIGRFSQIDLLADAFEHLSPYLFANNNPILLTGGTGLSADSLGKPEKGFINTPATAPPLEEVIVYGTYCPKPSPIPSPLPATPRPIVYIAPEPDDAQASTNLPLLNASAPAIPAPPQMARDPRAVLLVVAFAFYQSLGSKSEMSTPFFNNLAQDATYHRPQPMFLPATGASKNEKHGDNGRAKAKAAKQIEQLEAQLRNASGNEKKKLRQKIQNIRKTAEAKDSGEEHSRGNKR